MRFIPALSVALVAAAAVAACGAILACGPRPKANIDTLEVRAFGDPVYVSDTAAGARVVEALLPAVRTATEAGTVETLETGDLPYVRVSLLVPEKVAGGEADRAVVLPAADAAEILVQKSGESAWRRLVPAAEAVAGLLAAADAAAGEPVGAAFRAGDAGRAAARAASDRLLDEEGLFADAVVSVEAGEWPDASMGCPEEGMAYAQVVTPGHRVVLEAEGKRVEYRVAEGGAVARCGEPA